MNWIGGNGAPLGIRGREVVDWLREGEAELVAGSARAEEELCAAAAAFWGVGVGKEQKSEGNVSRGYL